MIWKSLLIILWAAKETLAKIKMGYGNEIIDYDDIYSMKQTVFEDKMLSKGMGNLCRYNASDYTYNASQFVQDLNFEIDWRNLDAINPPKNQAGCPASWAFASVAAIEAHESILTGDRVKEYSVQQILDCISRENATYTCDDGTPTHAYNYIQKAGGLENSLFYPLKDNLEKDSKEMSKCKTRLTNTATEVSGGSGDIKPYDEKKLMSKLLMNGPVTVMIDATYLKDYKEGIWNGTNPLKTSQVCSENQEDLNHVLLIVGVGVDEQTGQHYYLAQNSWGETWGEKGYVRFERRYNFCGMSVCATYPKIRAF